MSNVIPKHNATSYRYLCTGGYKVGAPTLLTEWRTAWLNVGDRCDAASFPQSFIDWVLLGIFVDSRAVPAAHLDHR